MCATLYGFFFSNCIFESKMRFFSTKNDKKFLPQAFDLTLQSVALCKVTI